MRRQRQTEEEYFTEEELEAIRRTHQEDDLNEEPTEVGFDIGSFILRDREEDAEEEED